MRVELARVEPTRLDAGLFHLVEVALPSGRLVQVYCPAEPGEGTTGEVDVLEGEGRAPNPVWVERP